VTLRLEFQALRARARASEKERVSSEAGQRWLDDAQGLMARAGRGVRFAERHRAASESTFGVARDSAMELALLMLEETIRELEPLSAARSRSQDGEVGTRGASMRRTSFRRNVQGDTVFFDECIKCGHTASKIISRTKNERVGKRRS